MASTFRKTSNFLTLVGKTTGAARALAASTYAGALANPNDSLTKPVDDIDNGVFVFQPKGELEQITPISKGDNNAVYLLRIVVWQPIQVGDLTTWTPTVLADLTCTASARVGVTKNGDTAIGVSALWRYADTIETSADRSLNPPGIRLTQTSAGGEDMKSSIILDGLAGSVVAVYTTLDGGGAADPTHISILHGGLSG